MSKTATIHARLDEKIKSDALSVFDTLGISVSEAITLYFRQVALKNAIPFEISTERVPRNNLDRVHEYRRGNLQKLLDVLPQSVDELWVFGSSVTPYCRPDSDLDILLIGNGISMEESNLAYRAPGCAVDLLVAAPDEFEVQKLEQGSIYNEVFTKGLLIYKKGVGLVG